MKLAGRVALLILIAVLFSCSFVHSRDRKWLHFNVDWMDFGPAIIESSKRIDLHVEHDGDFELIEGDKNFLTLKSWVRDHFQEMLNMSPNDTRLQAKMFPVYLTLYSATRGAVRDKLVGIPLSGKMLSMDEHAFSAELDKLKKEMTPIR